MKKMVMLAKVMNNGHAIVNAVRDYMDIVAMHGNAEYDGSVHELSVNACGNKAAMRGLCSVLNAYSSEFEISGKPCAAVIGKRKTKLYASTEHYFFEVPHSVCDSSEVTEQGFLDGFKNNSWK